MSSDIIDREANECGARPDSDACHAFQDELRQEYRKLKEDRDIKCCALRTILDGAAIGAGIGASAGLGVLAGMGGGVFVGYSYGSLYKCTGK